MLLVEQAPDLPNVLIKPCCKIVIGYLEPEG
jgi:hypothetical protein